MIKKYWKTILTVFFFVVIVPIIINESYKAETIYVTMWEAQDILAYYGGLLGVAGAIYILTRTINSSINQIQAERFAERKNAKWNKVEEVITETLADIMPFNMIYSDEATEDPSFIYISKIINQLQRYSFKAKTSLNRIKCYVSPTDYPKVEFLVHEIHTAILDFCAIAAEIEAIHRKQRDALIKNHGVFPQDALKAYGDNLFKAMKKILPTMRNNISDSIISKEMFWDESIRI